MTNDKKYYETIRKHKNEAILKKAIDSKKENKKQKGLNSKQDWQKTDSVDCEDTSVLSSSSEETCK